MKTYESPLGTTKAGFGRLVLAEFVKLRSVPRWMLTLAAAVLLTVLVATLTVLGAQVATSNGGGQPPPPPAGLQPFTDGGHFAYRTMTGDGTLTARVAAQTRSSPWAKAGLMIRSGEEPDVPFVAVMVTPDHGIRVRAGHEYEAAAGDGRAPTWLRLTLTGTKATAYASADGTAWRELAVLDLPNRPNSVDAGVFVASPDHVRVERQFGGESLSGETTTGEAVFDSASVTTAAGPVTGEWIPRARTIGNGPVADAGEFKDEDGTLTLSGPGDLGPDAFAEDRTKTALTSALIGVTAVIALAALFVTVEYRRGMIRTTLMITPRRGRVFAAKALVIGGAAFAAGTLAALGAVLAVIPIQRSKGLPLVPIGEWPVWRALIGTGVLMALVAVFSMAVGLLTRRAAPAITAVLVALLLPRIVASGLPIPVATWLERLTPSAGFAIQQTIERYDVVIAPYAGLGVLAAYTAVAAAFAVWRLKRSDA